MNMDRQDALYLVSAILIAGGAALFAPGAGLIVLGLMLALPFVAAFFTEKGPEK